MEISCRFDEVGSWVYLQPYLVLKGKSSFIGVVLVAVSDSAQTSAPGSERMDTTFISTVVNVSKPIFGDALALLSAIFYALYVILLKVRIGSESRIDMQQFFGFVGLFNIISCWPLGVILNITGIEPFELPSTQKAVAALLTNASPPFTLFC